MESSGEIRVAVIGLGRWGSNYLRTIQLIDGMEIRWVSAATQKTVSKASASLDAFIQGTTDPLEAINAADIDAVIIATPGSTHFDLAKKSLEAGKHILVEKPVAFKADEVQELINLAAKGDLLFMAAHIHLYNSAIIRLKRDIDDGVFGKIRYIQSIGSGPGPVRTDMGALWDYLPHDVSIMLYLLNDEPHTVSAVSGSYLGNGVGDVVSAQLNFPGGVVATAFGSWLHPVKQRRLILVGEKGQAIFDDYAEDKLTYFDQFGGNGRAVPIDDTPPLKEQLRHFRRCILEGRTPRTDGEEALAVTKVLERVNRSISLKKKSSLTQKKVL